MANTLFRHTHDHHHLNSINIAYSTLRTRQDFTMRRPRVQTKLSKLQLLQNDYRSRLLHEKEQKLNALMDRRIRENSTKLPKQGSVREFFLNRRMVTANSTTVGPQNGATLPPIRRNSRYDGVRSDKNRFVVQECLPNTKEIEKVNPEQSIQFGITKENDAILRELVKLRKGRRKGQGLETEIDPATLSTVQPKEKVPNTNFSSTNDKKTAGRHERKNTVAASHRKKPRSELQIYKRGTKTSHELASSNESSKNAAQVEQESWCTKTELSKSLVKIKELSRRKTEEMIQLRTTTASKISAERKHSQPTPRPEDSRNLDDMCQLEMELRETISRERKKLLALKQRKEKMQGKTTKETPGDGLAGGRGVRNPGSKILKETQCSADKGSTSNMDETRDKASQEDPGKPSPSVKPSPQISRNPESENAVSTDSVSETELLACSNCGRRFMKERISKHENACKKVSARKKKPFDARRKRAEGTDMEEYLNAEKKTSEISKPTKEVCLKHLFTRHFYSACVNSYSAVFISLMRFQFN